MKIKVKEAQLDFDYYEVTIKYEGTSVESVYASSPEMAKRIATQRVKERCGEVAIKSTEVEEA